MNSGHLTSEQMDALLAHPETPEGSQHLEVCAACSAELESLQAVMTDLRAAVIGSAGEHRRLAVMPAPAQRTPRAMWSLVAATALLCVAGPILMHTRPAHVAVVQAPQPQVQGAVSDEQLMSDIQQDLSSSVPQAMLPLTAKDASVSATDATSNVKENE
jgi:anti-sigma factor RsiW